MPTTTHNKLIMHIEQNVLAPASPRSIKAMHMALCRIYATVYAIPPSGFVMAKVKSESLSRLGDENIARIETIVDAWRDEMPLPTFKKTDRIAGKLPHIPDEYLDQPIE